MAKQRKPLKKQPTTRQIKAAQLLSENIIKDKPDSVETIMKQAGYTDSVARRSTQVTRSQGFMALMDSIGISDEKLAQKLDEGLEATRAVVMGSKEDSFVDIQPDFQVRHKYLETGLRLKGLGKEAPSINIGFHVKSDDQRKVYDL